MIALILIVSRKMAVENTQNKIRIHLPGNLMFSPLAAEGESVITI